MISQCSLGKFIVYVKFNLRLVLMLCFILFRWILEKYIHKYNVILIFESYFPLMGDGMIEVCVF